MEISEETRSEREEMFEGYTRPKTDELISQIVMFHMEQATAESEG